MYKKLTRFNLKKINIKHEDNKFSQTPKNSTVSYKVLGVELPVLVKEEYKDAANYIPAGSFVSGVLRGGISASTRVGASSYPAAIFIRITGSGDAPKKLKINLTNCRIIGNCYGHLSNERVIARAEKLSCMTSNGKVIETEIAGVVHGTDSKNGIKGTVVSIASKHLKNAAMGGMLSGFAKNLKADPGFIFDSKLGRLHNEPKNIMEGVNAVSEGTANAPEKLADYYLKMAEASSPVIEHYHEFKIFFSTIYSIYRQLFLLFIFL